MPDITSIGAALSALKTATELAKLLKDSSASLKDAETKLKMVELLSSLADTKSEIADIKHLLIEKDEQLLEFKNQLNQKKQLEYEAPYYWLIGKNGEKDGPYCQHCYDNNAKLIRLQSESKQGFWRCTVCKQSFSDSSYVEEKWEDIFPDHY